MPRCHSMKTSTASEGMRWTMTEEARAPRTSNGGRAGFGAEGAMRFLPEGASSVSGLVSEGQGLGRDAAIHLNALAGSGQVHPQPVVLARLLPPGIHDRTFEREIDGDTEGQTRL